MYREYKECGGFFQENSWGIWNFGSQVLAWQGVRETKKMGNLSKFVWGRG
jgi:hypothetical protein